jgi:glutathione S-transferase
MHSGFMALRQFMPMNCRAENRKIIMNDELQADIDRVIQIWADCRSKHAKSGPWLFGQFSIADAMYAPVAFRFASYGVFVENEAREYLDYLLTHPAMQEWRLAACEEIEVLEHEEVGIGTQ